MSKVVVGIMVVARMILALACVIGIESCSGDVSIDGQIEVCPDPEPCVTCAELVTNGGDARNLCDAELEPFYKVWSCIVDAPQCTVCPAWSESELFTPTSVDQACLECMILEGCGAELDACGVTVLL